jgi:epoxyqueuosine reductase
LKLTHQQSFAIEQKSQTLGFSLFGVSKAEFLEQEAPRLESFLKNE